MCQFTFSFFSCANDDKKRKRPSKNTKSFFFKDQNKVSKTKRSRTFQHQEKTRRLAWQRAPKRMSSIIWIRAFIITLLFYLYCLAYFWVPSSTVSLEVSVISRGQNLSVQSNSERQHSEDAVVGLSEVNYFWSLREEQSQRTRHGRLPAEFRPGVRRAEVMVSALWAEEVPFVTSQRRSALLPPDYPSVSGQNTTFFPWADMAHASFSPQTQSAFEGYVQGALQCHSRGRRRGANSYFERRGAKTACVSLPKDLTKPHTGEPGSLAYQPPPDPSVLPTITALARNGQELDGNVVNRRAPTAASRWLFDDWRLWEGELGCPVSPENADLSKDADPRSFATSGRRYDDLPIKELYQLEYFCIDDHDSSLVGLGGDAHLDVEEPAIALEEWTCRSHAIGMLLRKENHKVVPIVGNVSSAQHGWQSVMSSSLAEHYRKEANAQSRPYLAPSVMFIDEPAMMMPCDGQNRMNPSHAYFRTATLLGQAKLLNTTNTIFVQDVTAGNEVVGVTAAYRTDFFGDRQRARIRGGGLTEVSIDRAMAVLLSLPSYLLKNEERANVDRFLHTRGIAALGSAGDVLQRVSNASKDGTSRMPKSVAANLAVLLRRSPVMAFQVERQPPTKSKDDVRTPPLTYAQREVFGAHASFDPLAYMYGASLSSGEACESFRCAKGISCTSEGLAEYRKCARPYVAVPVIDADVKEYPLASLLKDSKDSESRLAILRNVFKRSDFAYRPGTLNFSKSVWINCVRATYREAKTLRHDLMWNRNAGNSTRRSYFERDHAVEENEPFPDAPQELRELILGHNDMESRSVIPYSYILEWRSRLLARARSGNSKWNRDHALHDYVKELFAVLLEVGHLREIGGFPFRPAHKRPSFMCYRKAYVFQMSATPLPYLSYATAHDRGQYLACTPGNCNSREILQAAYRSHWERFGMCPTDSNTRPKSEGSRQETNRDAHPLFTLPSNKRAYLREQFALSIENIEAVLRDGLKSLRDIMPSLIKTEQRRPGAAPDFFSYGGTRIEDSVLPRALGLVKRVSEAQRAYDNELMAYLNRTGIGRPIRLFSPHRSFSRSFALWSQIFSVLTADGIQDYIDFEFSEGIYGSTASPRDPAYRQFMGNAREAFNTARARQLHAALSADLMLGIHGADMHQLGLLKPSALVTEIGVPGTHPFTNPHFNYGFFSPMAFGRNIGYLRTLANIVDSWPDRKEERGRAPQIVLSLPEVRQLYSVTTCSWLATNAVRLADEDRAAGREPEDYSFIVPWWCRGGAAPVVRRFFRAVAHFSVSAKENAHPFASLYRGPVPSTADLLAAQATVRPSYYTTRSIPSGYGGFVIPYCVPLEPSVRVDHNGSVSIESVTITYAHLPRLQNHCARNVTSGTHGELILRTAKDSVEDTIQQKTTKYSHTVREGEAQRLRVEGLQTLIEAALLMQPVQAQRISAAMVEGLAKGGIDFGSVFNTVSSVSNLTCGEQPLMTVGWHYAEGSHAAIKECLTEMIYALADPQRACPTSFEERFPLVSQNLLNFMNVVLPLPNDVCSRSNASSQSVSNHEDKVYAIITEEGQREAVAEWIAYQFVRISGRVTIGMPSMPLTSHHYSYGNNCSIWNPENQNTDPDLGTHVVFTRAHDAEDVVHS